MCTIKHTTAPTAANEPDKPAATSCNCRPAPQQRCPHMIQQQQQQQKQPDQQQQQQQQQQPPQQAQQGAPLNRGASHEDLDNNENERRKPELLN